MGQTIVGIDVGGTFTDFAVLSDGALSVYKIPSSPADPSRSVLQGVQELGVDGASFVHGSTVATNVLLERRGSPTALITTGGFEDVLEIGRQSRAELYNLDLEKTPVLVPTDLRFGLAERVEFTGSALQSPSPDEIRKLASAVAASGAEAVAVSLLFSFLNPLHEEMLLEALREVNDNLYYSVSSQVLPEFREYERTSTVVVNAYVGPSMSRYLGNLEGSLGSGLRIMQSSGGSITASLASRQPVRTILSGPAGACGRRLLPGRDGRLSRHHHPGYGRDIDGCLPVPRQDQGDHYFQPGRVPPERAHDRDPQRRGRWRLHRPHRRGRRPAGWAPVGGSGPRTGLLRQRRPCDRNRRQPHPGEAPG